MRVLDLAESTTLPPTEATALVLFLQEGMAPARLAAIAAALGDAVGAGAGIVNCDPDLEVDVPAPGVPLRFTARGWAGVRAARRARLDAPAHFIAEMQRSYREFPFRKPVPSQPAPVEGEQAILVDEDGGCLLGLREAPARMVQWRLSSWVWSQDFHGFARGMDALFWRGALWAARKPFALAALPPLGRFRFDDCRGLWRTPADLAFLDVMREFGEVPNLGICLSAVEKEAWTLLAARAGHGEIEVTPHVQAPETGIFNVAEAPGAEAGRDPLAERIERLFAEHRCPMACGVSDHNHELSARGIRIARDLGMSSRMNVMRAGETWEGEHRRWRPAPFGCMHFALAPLPDAPELFTAINHHASFSDSFLDLGGDRFLCTPFGGFTDDRWDFLNGLVGPGRNDLEPALERLLRHAELAMTSLFFVGSISHTHFVRHLGHGDWKFLLEGYRSWVDRFGYRPCAYDRIAAAAAGHGAGTPAGRLVVTERGGATVAAWDAEGGR
jgi:hypothetical protein